MMTKREMREGFLAGRILVQEEPTSEALEITFANELIAEGCAFATKWTYVRAAGCRIRLINGTGDFADRTIVPLSLPAQPEILAPE